MLDPEAHGAGHSCTEVPGLCSKFHTHRHRQFGGGSGRRRPAVGHEVDQCGVGLVPHRGYQRDVGSRRRPRHDLLVEPPEVLDGAAPPCHDQQVRTRQGTAALEAVEPLDGPGHLRRAGRTLHRHRPDQHLARETIAQPVQDIPDDRARRRGHDTDDVRQVRQGFLAPGVEQAFRRQRRLALFQHRHQRARACRTDILQHDLVLRLPREGGQPSGGHHLHPLLRLGLQARRHALPHHPGDHRPVVLQVQVHVPGARPRHAPHLAPHPDETELPLDHALHRARKLGDREFRRVAIRAVVDQVHATLSCPHFPRTLKHP